MDGDVAVESTPGVGSTFTVTLICTAAPADSPLKTTLRAGQPPGAGHDRGSAERRGRGFWSSTIIR